MVNLSLTSTMSFKDWLKAQAVELGVLGVAGIIGLLIIIIYFIYYYYKEAHPKLT